MWRLYYFYPNPLTRHISGPINLSVADMLIKRPYKSFPISCNRRIGFIRMLFFCTQQCKCYQHKTFYAMVLFFNGKKIKSHFDSLKCVMWEKMWVLKKPPFFLDKNQMFYHATLNPTFPIQTKFETMTLKNFFFHSKMMIYALALRKKQWIRIK